MSLRLPWRTAFLLVWLQISPVCAFGQTHALHIPTDERAALIDLYQSTDGPHWKNTSGWLEGPGTECDWYGVTCAGIQSEGYVVSLSLFDNNLSGTIPETLAQLTRLEWLVLYGNKLSGRIPNALIQRWLAGPLDIHAESRLLTDVSEIDYEWDASALLCARHRIVLRSDDSITMYSTKCRNATPHDRVTFCEIKKGKSFGFASMAFLLDKNGFYSLQHEYSQNVTDSAFARTRVERAGKSYEVIEYAGGAPLELWTIQRSIEGVASSIEWTNTTKQSTCPKW